MRFNFSVDKGCKTVSFLSGIIGTTTATVCQLYSSCPTITPNSYEVNVESYGRAFTGETVDVDCTQSRK